MENEAQWLSKSYFKSFKTISKINKPPKISSSRYGALKTLQLPAETAFKQTNLFHFVKQKSVKQMKNIEEPISVIRKFSKVNSRKKKHIDVNLTQAKLINFKTNCISARCKCTEQQSKQQIVSSDMISNKIQADHSTNCLNSQKPNTEVKPLKEPDEQSPAVDKKMETQWFKKNTKESSHKVDAKIGAPQTLLINESPSRPIKNYDMTMRFVADSQGAMQFDHFSQKENSCDDIMTGISLDSQLYLEFANGIGLDHQSTQII